MLSLETNTNAQLIRYDAACRALAEAKATDEVLEIANRAEAMRAYGRQAKNRQLEVDAAEIRIRAERRLGQMILEQKATVGLNPGTRFRGIAGGSTVEPPPTLAEAGIDKKLSSHAQKYAALPEQEFEGMVDRWRDGILEGQDPVSVNLARKIRAEKRASDVSRDIEVIEKSPSFSALEGIFRTIVIDPPWDFSDEGDVNQFGRARPDYQTLSFSEIKELPIQTKAASDSHLYLWITNRSLPKGFELLSAWGFGYVTCLTWCKPSIGMGNYFRGQTEHVLFGVRGSLPLARHDVGTWFSAPRPGKHSGKPDKFYELVESCSPGPYLDVFYGVARDAWKSWGPGRE